MFIAKTNALYTYNLRGYISCGILDNIIKSIKAKQQKRKATEQPGEPPVPAPKRRQRKPPVPAPKRRRQR